MVIDIEKEKKEIDRRLAVIRERVNFIEREVLSLCGGVYPLPPDKKRIIRGKRRRTKKSQQRR